jgi:hypothetical protein
MRWCGRMGDIGDDVKVVCRRSAAPFEGSADQNLSQYFGYQLQLRLYTF